MFGEKANPTRQRASVQLILFFFFQFCFLLRTKTSETICESKKEGRIQVSTKSFLLKKKKSQRMS